MIVRVADQPTFHKSFQTGSPNRGNLDPAPLAPPSVAGSCETGHSPDKAIHSLSAANLTNRVLSDGKLKRTINENTWSDWLAVWQIWVAATGV
jgi:hypothetical protein